MRLLVCVALCLCILGVYGQQFTPPQLTPGQLTPGSFPTGTGLGSGVPRTGPRPGVFQNPVRTPIPGTAFGRPFGPVMGPFGPTPGVRKYYIVIVPKLETIININGNKYVLL